MSLSRGVEARYSRGVTDRGEAVGFLFAVLLPIRIGNIGFCVIPVGLG